MKNNESNKTLSDVTKALKQINKNALARKIKRDDIRFKKNEQRRARMKSGRASSGGSIKGLQGLKRL